MADSLIPAGDWPSENLQGDALQTTLMSRLKKETQRAVLTCHALHREMAGLETPLTVLSWITVWIRDWDLHEDDAVTLLRAMTAPDKAKKHKFASDLKTSMADAADVLIKRRAMTQEMLSRRAEAPATTAAEQIIGTLVERFSA